MFPERLLSLVRLIQLLSAYLISDIIVMHASAREGSIRLYV